MKRIYALILALAMMFTLAACKDSSGTGGNTGTGTKPPSTGSDFTQAEIEKILEEMEEEEAKAE